MSGKPENFRPRSYGGWQQEKVAFIFGLSAQRALALAAGVLAAIWPLATGQLSEAVVCWPAAMILAGAALARIAGRTAGEWVTVALSYYVGAARDQQKFAAAAFTPPGRGGNSPPMDLPGILAPLRILESADGTAEPVAVIHHPLDRTYTAVAKIRYPGIGLADSARRDLRVDGWGALLSGLCAEGQPITRIQALHRLLPESGAALRHWHAAHLDPAAPDAAVEVTSALLATSTLATSRREAYLAFTLDARRAASAIRAAGGGSAGAAVVLVRHLRALTGPAAAADLHIESWLSPRDLAEVLRTAFDPSAVAGLAERRAAAMSAAAAGLEASAVPGASPALAGPAAAEARPGCYLHDGVASAAYWVHDWPRSQIYSTALGPLLGEAAYRKSFSLYIEPLPPKAAERQVMRERTARDVAIRMRQRTGQIVPAHEQAAIERARAQDADRAAGHGLVRFTAYVVTTVTDLADLDDACAALEAEAAAARIEIRRMWFAQDIGFALGALPAGMGLPRRRW
jgi:hypothetical protein